MTSTLKTEKIQFRGDNSDAITLASSGKVGIGTASPEDILHVKGFARIESNAGDAAYVRFDNDVNSGGKIWRAGAGVSSHGTFSIYNQTDNKFAMTADAQGQVIQPLIPAAQASKNISSQVQNISGSSTYVIGSLNSSYTNSHSVNNGSYFDSSTSKFTVPSGATTARYFCLLQVLIGITRPSSGVNWGTIQIRKNGAGANNTPFEAYREATNGMGTSTYVYDTMTVGGVIQLAATDYLEPMFGGSAGVDILIHSGTYTSFSVIKIG